ncbi:MAG: hypothetical protein SOX60_08595 [Prevotella sp.]|nr:hypothetical protein [Prevotella sp.]
MKNLLFLLFAVTLFCCCSSDNDDNNNLNGFELYEGTWGPVSYTLKGKVYPCNPEYPNINNIDRLVFLRWEDDKVIIRYECFYNGEWKHRADQSFIWRNGKFYKIKLVGSSNVEMGEPYTAITIDGGFMYNSDYEGVKFKKIK